MANAVKDKLARGVVCWGVWLDWLHPGLVEFYGLLGFEYVVIDGEHIPVEPSTCQELVRACEVVGMVPIVRVRANDQPLILGFLETGVLGIYVPHVNTADDARAIVRAVKYAPVGNRADGVMRPGRYGQSGLTPAEVYRNANDDTMTIALLEDVQALRNLDEILTVEGIDVFGVGDGDLSHSLGHAGDKKHPDVVAAVLETERRLAAAGRTIDAVVGDVEEARDALARGSTMISVSDRALIGTAAGTFLEQARAIPR